MGQRDRKDPAGHKPRGKGEPTPAAVNGSPGAASGPGHREARGQRQAEAQIPPCTTVLVAEVVAAGINQHPAIPGPLLDMMWAAPGAKVVVRVPIEAWPSIRDEIEQVYQAASAQGQGGVALAGPADVAAEAKAAEQRAEVDRQARGEQG